MRRYISKFTAQFDAVTIVLLDFTAQILHWFDIVVSACFLLCNAGLVFVSL